MTKKSFFSIENSTHSTGLLSLVSSLALMVFLSGCNQSNGDKQATDSAKAKGVTAASTLKPEEIVATVNGHAIGKSALILQQ